MFARINKILSKFKKNNKGLSIVTVIVAIGFVLIIVSILMTTSTINFRMKNVNYYAKDSFYSSEQVLDEINAGLQQLVSEGLSSAYKEVLTTYGQEDFNSDDKNEMVKGAYYNYIIDKLGYQVDGTTWRYVAMPSSGPSGAAAGTVYASASDASSAGVKEGLYSFIKSSTRWHEGGIDGSYGAYLRAKGGLSETPSGFTNGVYYGEMKVTASDGIYLKDLIVYYRDSNGVVSEVKTDIHLVYPEFAFSNPSMPEISSYTFITDSGLIEEKKGISKGSAVTTKIIGDSYAYKVETIGVKLDYSPSGTVLEPAVDTHIVATGLDVVNGGIKTYDSTRLWADDIIAKSSTVNLDGYTYVRDDINLQGKNPSLTITGTYTGYGNSLNSAEESSAILVNGVNSMIDLEYVKKLSLAGRAFIGLSKGSSTASNVYIGSSISAKSDQLMYLIPGECIGVDASGNSRFAKNPLTKAEYDEIVKPENNYTLIARGKHLDKLGTGTTSDKLDDYIKEGDDGYKRVEVTSKDGHTTLYYFYMSFKNDEAANLFFEKYYNQNMNSVDKYLNQYIGQLTFPGDTDAMLRVSMAGNTLEDTTEVGTDGYKKHVVAGIYSTKKSDAENIAESFEDENKAFSEQFIAYTTKLTPSLDNVAELIQRAGDNKAVYKNIVNQASFEEVLDGSNHMFFEDATGAKKAVLIHRAPITPETNTTPAEYATVTLTSEDMGCSLIIADCNVKIPDGITSFEGTMLVQGTIEIPATAFEFKANPKAVNRCMVLQDSLGIYSVYDVFNDVAKMSSAALNGIDSEDIYLSDLVQFSNWSRSANINAGTTGG